VEAALRSRNFGVYSLQAAIAAVHAEAPGTAATDWAQIVGLYDALLRLHPSPVVELNRAVAVAMRDGYAAGIALIEPLLQQPALRQYQPAHAALGELCLRAGLQEQARQSLQTALELASSDVEKRHLERRLATLNAGR
jgi:RNA polymerase sigma-70 factor, ECF subfamily